VDLVFRSQAQAEDAWTAILEEVRHLVNTLNVMDQIQPQADLSIGNPPPADFPTNSSSSSSGAV
jgi:hypothetical protein